jgi:RNA polymerase sigma-70 factor, ECF subfamily
MVRNTTDAEDLTQEVFLQVFRKMDTFRGDSAFSTWLHRVAVNVVLMNTRKRRHYVEVPIEPEQDEETTRPTPELEVVDRNLSSATDRIDLQRAIAELPPSCKTTLVLYELCGYRHMEIAKLMGTSYSNSKSQLRRARIRMRRLLSQNRPLRVRKARTAFQLAAAEANSDAPNSIHSFALQKLAVGTEPPDTMKENSAADPAWWVGEQIVFQLLVGVVTKRAEVRPKDNGTQFTSSHFLETVSRLGITHRRTAFHHL